MKPFFSISFFYSFIFAFLWVFIAPAFASAFEYSSIADSTVIGANFGAPTGMGAHFSPPLRKPGIAIETAIFIKNLEISGLSDEGIEGETFIQSLVPARLFYQANERTRIEIGALLGHLFGEEEEIDTAAPLARIVYEPGSGLSLVAGTLFPTHPIHDAMIDDIRKFGTNDATMTFHSQVEQGFQFRADRKRFKQDLWINWKVREERKRREAFEAASVSILKFFDEALWTTLQVRTVHIGGQNNALDQGVDENLSLAAGLSWGIKQPFGRSRISDLRLRADYLSSSDSTRLQSSESGEGVEVGLAAELPLNETVKLLLHGSHYSGSGFYAMEGDPLYQLDNYSQFGVTSLFTLDREFTIETGATGQITGDAFNFSMMVTFLWGHGFF